jgi:hypothetical protein
MMTWGASKTVHSVRSITANEKTNGQVQKKSEDGVFMGFFPLIVRMMKWSRVWRDRANDNGSEEKKEGGKFEEQDEEEEEEEESTENNEETEAKPTEEEDKPKEETNPTEEEAKPKEDIEGKRCRCKIGV